MFSRHMESIAEVLKGLSKKYAGKKRFLDVGCGDGTRTVLFDDGERRLTGVDFKDWLDGSARGRMEFFQADIMEDALPFEDEAFDMVLSFDVIEHLPNPERLLVEMRRVLRKEGVLILSTPNRNRPFGVFLSLIGRRTFPYGVKKDDDPFAQHIREYTAGELEELLREEGFPVLNCNRVFYGITGWYGVTRLSRLPFFHNIIMECVRREANS